MDIVKDVVEKYSVEQIVDYLDKLSTGVLKNYQTAIKASQPAVLFGSIGDLAQIRAILHEMNKQNQERAARARAAQGE